MPHPQVPYSQGEVDLLTRICEVEYNLGLHLNAENINLVYFNLCQRVHESGGEMPSIGVIAAYMAYAAGECENPIQ